MGNLYLENMKDKELQEHLELALVPLVDLLMRYERDEIAEITRLDVEWEYKEGKRPLPNISLQYAPFTDDEEEIGDMHTGFMLIVAGINAEHSLKVISLETEWDENAIPKYVTYKIDPRPDITH